MSGDRVEADASRSTRLRWLAPIAGILLFAGVTVVWSLRPFDDHVPLVLPERNKALVENPAELPVAATFRCSPVLGGEDPPVPDRGAVEALELQALTRAPCEEIRDQRRPLVAVEVALAVGALGALAWMSARRRTLTGPATAR